MPLLINNMTMYEYLVRNILTNNICTATSRRKLVVDEHFTNDTGEYIVLAII